MKIIGEEDKSKIIEGIATATLNSFNINGLVQAAKFYSVHLANEQYTNMSEDDDSKFSQKLKPLKKKLRKAQRLNRKKKK